ncbi:tetratricopeptide repeat protein [Streptomyces sp. NPDC059477]|uniref:tetratricopeptide repeat protein n=1 Tax=Streptomyces sp. NPDC059477 TaxID=3346847 RepID=UPI00368C3ED6
MVDRMASRTGYVLTIPDGLLDSDAMRRACAARDFQEIFRLVNRRTGSSYAVISSAVGKMTSGRVSDIVRGVRRIRGQEVIERVCDGFGIPGEMLGVSERSWESIPAHDYTLQDKKWSSAKKSESLDLVTVANLRQQIQTLDSRYATEPSTVLVARTGSLLGTLVQWLDYSAPHPVIRDLQAAVTEASTLMGQLVWDASGRTDHSTARGYFEQAVSVARELGDPVAEGLAMLRTSFVALYGEKNPSEGLQLTRQVTAKVGKSSSALSGLAFLHSAEAHAMLRQRSECEESLRDAERFFDRAGENDAGASLLSPGQFGRLAGSCFLFLGDAPRAETLLRETATRVLQGSKSQAIVLANLALAHIRQGKIDEAVGAVHRAIEVVEGNRGGGGFSLIFKAGKELQNWNSSSDVKSLNSRLFGLIAA